MKRILAQILVVVVLAGSGWYVYANYLATCSVRTYSIGSMDPRFGISDIDFVKLAQDTESIWEKPLQKDFFRYDSTSDFKINLVFDERQQRTIDENNTRSEINSQEDQYHQDVQDYQTALAEYNQSNADYESDVAVYQARLQKYNEQVDYWNSKGGAPSSDYAVLQKEKAALQREAKRLDTVRQQLNKDVTVLNSLAAGVNSTAKDLNLDVNAYNGKFGESREFDQGNYTGKAINIYQFNTRDDLALVLAHEFGHALGAEHVNDPNAIMYYLMDKQNLKDLAATPADLNEVRSSCHIR